MRSSQRGIHAAMAAVEPDLVMACCGDVPTLETLAAVSILRTHLPALNIRVVNIVDLMKLQPEREHPHGLGDEACVFPGEHDGGSDEGFLPVVSGGSGAKGAADADGGDFTEQDGLHTACELERDGEDLLDVVHAAGGADDQLLAADLDVTAACRSAPPRCSIWWPTSAAMASSCPG